MKGAFSSYGKWVGIILISVLVHVGLFAINLKHEARVAEREEFNTIEIDLDVIQEPAELVAPSTNPSPQNEEPIEEAEDLPSELEEAEPPPVEKAVEESEEVEPLPTPAEIAAEQQRLEELEKETERKKELERQERKKQELAEQARKKKEAERAKQKKQEAAKKAKALAAKKASDAVAKKKKAAENAKRKAAKAASAKQAALTKKKVKSASATSRRKPLYPKKLERKGIEGIVKVKVVINQKGRVERATISKSSGYPSFDQSALKSIQRWKYKPALNGLGQPISETKIETVVFRKK